MTRYILMTDTFGESTWINPDLVVQVFEGQPRDGRKVACLHLSGGFGRDVFGTPEEVVRLLQSE